MFSEVVPLLYKETDDKLTRNPFYLNYLLHDRRLVDMRMNHVNLTSPTFVPTAGAEANYMRAITTPRLPVE